MDLLKALKGKRTLIVNVLTLAAVVLKGQFGFDLPWFHERTALEILALVNIGLRFITTGPAWLVGS